jgi:regulatory protein
MQRERPQLSLKGRALRYLSQREHSRTELARKLAKYAQDPTEVELVLDDLEVRGFIDHRRVADSVVHRSAAKFGALRIKQELQDKGISRELITRALQQLHDTEITRAQAIWQRKFGSRPRSAAEWGKQTRFLAARGFDADVIRRVLNLAALQDRGRRID